MAYITRLNHSGLGSSDRVALIAEFDLLRAELDDIRAKLLSTQTKLDADATVTDTNYASLGALAAKRFTPA